MMGGNFFADSYTSSWRCFALLEILLALSVMSMVLIGISLALYDLPRVVVTAEEAAGALTRARRLLASSTEFSTALTFPPNPILSSTDSIYTSSLSVFPLEDESFFELRAQISWSNAFGVPQSEELSQVVGDPFATHTGCDPFVSGDWNHPVHVGTYAIPGTLSSLTTNSQNLIVALASTSLQTAPTLLFFNVQSIGDPLFTAGFDNAHTSRIGFSNVVVGDGYVFAGNAFSSASTVTCNDGISCAQVQVFSIPEKSTTLPSQVGAFSLSTSSAPFAVTSNGLPAPVQSLAYYHGYLFLGLQKTVAGSELNIVDARDPAHLRWVSGYRIGRTVNHIVVRGTYAYVSNDDPNHELTILDIHDPANPFVYGVWDAPGSQSFGYGSASTVLPPFIRFGRSYISNAPEFYTLDISDPLHIKSIGSSDAGTAKDPESVRAILTQGSLTFLLLTRRLEFWNTGNPSALTPFAPSYVLPPESEGVGSACRNNLIYVGENTASGTGVVEVLRGA